MIYRSIWISDVHLGTRHARADLLLDFLRKNESQYLYIVGDFIDGWVLKASWFWHDDYNVIIQKLLRKSRKRTKVIYITGNHDEFLEAFTPTGFGGLQLAKRAIHVGVDQKRYLVIHGHQFDGLVHCNRLLERLGAKALRLDFGPESAHQSRAPRARLRLLVLRLVPQAQGEDRGEVRHKLRSGDGGNGSEGARARSHLRAYPSSGDANCRWLPVLQLRRLGRELHRAR